MMVEAAPYKFVCTISTVDGKEVKLYYLGKQGKEIVENAASKDLVHSEVNDLNKKLWTLIEVIGRDTIITHFKAKFLDYLQTCAYRKSELVDLPFYFEKSEALASLFNENKVVKTKRGGWIKRINPKKEEA